MDMGWGLRARVRVPRAWQRCIGSRVGERPERGVRIVRRHGPLIHLLITAATCAAYVAPSTRARGELVSGSVEARGGGALEGSRLHAGCGLGGAEAELGLHGRL